MRNEGSTATMRSGGVVRMKRGEIGNTIDADATIVGMRAGGKNLGKESTHRAPAKPAQRAGPQMNPRGNGCERNDRRRSRTAEGRQDARSGRQTARARRDGRRGTRRRSDGPCRPSRPDPSSCAFHPTALPLLHSACRRTADRFPRPPGRRKASVTDAFRTRQPGKPERHAHSCTPSAIERRDRGERRDGSETRAASANRDAAPTDAPSAKIRAPNEKALLDSVQQRFGVRALGASIVSSFSTCKFDSRCIRTETNLKDP